MERSVSRAVRWSIATAANDRRQPGCDVAVLVEARGGAPCFQERLLGRLLGQTAVSKHFVRDSVDELSVQPIDGAHRVCVTLAKPPTDLTGLHSASDSRTTASIGALPSSGSILVATRSSHTRIEG